MEKVVKENVLEMFFKKIRVHADVNDSVGSRNKEESLQGCP